jgi:hypothetical protein
MMAAVRAGLFYFAVVFGLGFLLGILRGLLVAKGVASRDTLVFVEIPIVVAYAWFASGIIIRRINVPDRAFPRMIMGGVMFVMLRMSEAAVGLSFLGIGIKEQFVQLGTLRGLLEFLPQVLTAAFPLIHLNARCSNLPGMKA